jgi:hypothetical protein
MPRSQAKAYWESHRTKAGIIILRGKVKPDEKRSPFITLRQAKLWAKKKHNVTTAKWVIYPISELDMILSDEFMHGSL